MKMGIGSTADMSRDELALDEAMMEIAARMRRGESVDIEHYAGQLPHFADRLRKMLPGLAALVELGHEDATKQTADRAPLGQLGDYRINAEIGRGGMGVVYRAEQISLGREVAIKVLPFAAMMDGQSLKRFKNEARAAASLHHPHIVSVYGVGEERGVHFYAMQLIRGRSLADLIEQSRSSETSTDATGHRADRRLADDSRETVRDLQQQIATLASSNDLDRFQAIARIGVQAAEALDYAHRQGVLHRDIKPANLLIDADSQLYVADFGLARIEAQPGMTATGDFIGTLRYTSPEQVRSTRGIVDHRTDIYSLAATLYELACLRPAFDATDRHALLTQIVSEEPAAPRRINRGIPRELETIIVKAIAKDPEDRYATASEMADDLRRFLNGQSVVARPIGPLGRAIRWSRRRLALVLSVSIALMLAVVGLTVGMMLLASERSRTAAERDDAIANLRIALTAVDRMYTQFAQHWVTSDRDLTDTQRHYLDQARDTYEAIANRYRNEPEFRSIVAQAYLRAADLRSRLHQFEAAERGYHAALDLLQAELANAPPRSNVELLQLNLAQARFHLAKVYGTQNRLEEAGAAYSAAEAAYADFSRSHPDDVDCHVSLVTVRHRLAEIACKSGDWSAAAQLAESTVALIRKMLKDHPDELGLHVRHLWTVVLLASAFETQGRAAEAVTLCTDALQSSHVYLKDVHDDRRVLRAVAAVTGQLGRAHMSAGRHADAESALRAALRFQRRSFVFDGTPKEFSYAYIKGNVSHDQMEPEAYCDYAELQIALAKVLSVTGQHGDADETLNEAIRTCIALAGLFPHVPRYVLTAGNACDCVSELPPLADTDANEQRGTLIRSVVDLHRQLAKRTPQVSLHVSEFGETLGSYAKLLAGVGRADEAIVYHRESIVQHEAAVKMSPGHPEFVERLRQARHALAVHID